MSMSGRTRLNYCHIVVFFLLSPSLCSGLTVTLKIHQVDPKPKLTSQISSTQRDITTPITTVPTIIPTINPGSSIPIMNPNSNPDSTSPLTTTTPTLTPSITTTSPAMSGVSWCVASQSASPITLQVALDYACGYGGADCSAIQLGGSCYIPSSVRDHASYAFNSYYQKNPIPNSCNFGGTAMTTSTDPSSGTCQYPSTSTRSSVLNTTNSSGSRVFGAAPSGPSPPSAAPRPSINLQHMFTMTLLIVVAAK